MVEKQKYDVKNMFAVFSRPDSVIDVLADLWDEEVLSISGKVSAVDVRSDGESDVVPSVLFGVIVGIAPDPSEYSRIY